MNAKIQERARALGESILSLIVPDRSKRAIFLASFFAQLKDDNASVDKETLVKLNKAMDLVKREDSLGLPVQLNRAIWHGVNSKELRLDELQEGELTSARLRLVCSKVLEAMPKWLRYGDEAVIREDLVKLFGARAGVLAS
jgi:hypothetical protein